MTGDLQRWARTTLLLGAGLILAGCASSPAPQYQAAAESRPLGPGTAVAVGESKAAVNVKNSKVSLRGASMGSPSADGTFSGYLRDALIAELTASGRYSEEAERTIALELLRHEINASGIKEGEARLAVRVVVSGGKDGRFEKTYEATHTWPSSFVGAVAIPAAYDNYGTAVQKLLLAVLSDPGFQTAID